MSDGTILARLRDRLGTRGLAVANAVMLAVLLLHYWPAAVPWYGMLVMGAVAVSNFRRLWRAVGP
jgi:Na+-translocating ferredoxin:NAD+ oxidoreductase RnfD subunit